MKQESGFRNITFSVVTCVAVIFAVVCILLIAKNYKNARSKLDTYTLEVQGWDACRQTNPSYFAANKEAVSMSRKNLDGAQGNFWIRLSKAQLVGLFILAFLVSGTGGYWVTWAILWFGGLGIHRFIRPIYAKQDRESPHIIGAKLAQCEQNHHEFRGLGKGHYARVPKEYGKQEKPKKAISQDEKLLGQIKQLQHEIDNSRQTEARLEQQITDLMAANEQPEPPVANRKRAAEHHTQQTNKLLAANGPIGSGRERPKRNIEYDDSHHANIGKVRQKLCRKCKKQKVESDFHRDRSCKDGLARWCKECKAEAARKHRKKQMVIKN
jgi:hypothetical protein